MNHYSRNVGEWIASTAHLSAVEECFYLRIVDQYYLRETPLPSEPAAVCRLVRAGSDDERNAVEVVLAEFFALTADGWRQKRCDEQIAKRKDKTAKATASARQRWSKSNANAMRTHSERNANESRITSRGDLSAPDGVRDDVWTAWKNHRGKKLTPYAVRLQARKLAELAAAGSEPNAVLEQSIANGWSGLFPVVGKPGPKAPTLAEKRAANMALLTGGVANEKDISGVASRVDSAVVRTLGGDLRESGGDNVGGRERGRSAVGVG